MGNCRPLDEILERLDGLESYTMVRTGSMSERHLIGLDSNENYFAGAEFLQKIAREAARCDLRSVRYSAVGCGLSPSASCLRTAGIS
jgi:hypothetical protein